MLNFNDQKYEVKTYEMNGEMLVYRAFENIVYIEKPADDIQKLNIYVPECYYHGETVNGYDLKTAPILVPNSVGGYHQGPATTPGHPIFNKDDAVSSGIKHGYVVVTIGIRGRETADQKGVAPTCIVDYKAGVRYLRYNQDTIPGDVDKIISNGTSAGGALSALLGASGNHPDYEPYLKELGAADASDDIFASSCYCPITNLEHADMAYEWEFEGLNDYIYLRYLPDYQVEKIPGTMNDEQIQMSKELKEQFQEYAESLIYQNHPLTLDILKGYICKKIIQSAQKAMDQGIDLSSYEWIKMKDQRVLDIDYKSFIKFRTRMKPAPAFDNVNMGTLENELFGTSEKRYQHFTEFSTKHSHVSETIAHDHLIKMLNPMNYIDDSQAITAKYYRIRHGASDRDTSLAISAILTLMLQESGVKVDHFYPWGIVHAGDYDLDELFLWIDTIVKNETV